MASNREKVVIAGRLMGMGREVDGTVNAEKISLPGIIVSHFPSATSTMRQVICPMESIS